MWIDYQMRQIDILLRLSYTQQPTKENKKKLPCQKTRTTDRPSQQQMYTMYMEYIRIQHKNRSISPIFFDICLYPDLLIKQFLPRITIILLLSAVNWLSLWRRELFPRVWNECRYIPYALFHLWMIHSFDSNWRVACLVVFFVCVFRSLFRIPFGHIVYVCHIQYKIEFIDRNKRKREKLKQKKSG